MSSDEDVFEVVHGTQAIDTAKWLKWADADYSGARILLVMGLLVQGSALANTAIEKYLKAICCHAGIAFPHGHNANKLYEAIKNNKSRRDLSLNESYLALLHKAYKLRYPDDLEIGFNIVLNEAKILTQLDRSVMEITSRFRMVAEDKHQPTVIEEAKATNDIRILDRNIAINPALTAGLFSNPSHTYEIRNEGGELLEAGYQAFGLEDDLVFDTEGLAKHPTNPMKFTVAFPMLLKRRRTMGLVP